MKRVLVTGPVGRIPEWSRAARQVGWTPIPFPVVDVVTKDVDARDVLGEEPAIDWICLTSSNALPFLERVLADFPALAQVATAAVGASTTDALARLGCAIALEPSRDVHELAERVLARSARDERVLWPHGDRSDELAHTLRSNGLNVLDPIVYETRGRAGLEVPPAEAVLFASPSAVQAWHDRPEEDHEPRLAIAIGGTTLSALHAQTQARFERLMALPAPTPEAFADALAHVDVDK